MLKIYVIGLFITWVIATVWIYKVWKVETPDPTILEAIGSCLLGLGVSIAWFVIVPWVISGLIFMEDLKC